MCFIKQKTAYELRINDWSSDVCSSDLLVDIDGEAAQQAADEIRSDGGTVHVIVGDVTVETTLDAIADTVSDLGRVDVLVNNVGDWRPASKSFLHSKPEQWQRLYELNLKHVLTVTHRLLPTMVEQGPRGTERNGEAACRERGG